MNNKTVRHITFSLEIYEPPYELIIDKIKFIKNVTMDNRDDAYLCQIDVPIIRNDIQELSFCNYTINNIILLPSHVSVRIKDILKYPIFVAVFLLRNSLKTRLKKYNHRDLYYFAIAKASVETI